MPFLVPPNVSTSTPASTVNERRAPTEEPRTAAALAMRAPSMCTRMPRRCAASHSAATSSAVYTVPSSVLWVSASDRRLDVMLVPEHPGRRRRAARVAACRRVPAGRPAWRRRFVRGARLIGVDVRAGCTHDRVDRSQHRHQAEDVAAGTGERQERLTGPEELAEETRALLGPGIVSVGERVPVVGFDDRRDDIGMGSSRVVTGEGPFWRRRKLHAASMGEEIERTLGMDVRRISGGGPTIASVRSMGGGCRRCVSGS